jgi:hypothetical protein
VICQAPTDELLLVEWLNALIYEMAVRAMLFGDFAIEIDGDELRATAYGEVVDIVRSPRAIDVLENRFPCAACSRERPTIPALPFCQATARCEKRLSALKFSGSLEGENFDPSHAKGGR